MTLRTRILLLVLLALLPPVVVLVLFLGSVRDDEIIKARHQMRVTAQGVAADLEDVIRATAQLQYGLARARDLDTGDQLVCSSFLGHVLQEFQQYATLTTIRPDGYIFCDSLQSRRTLYLGDRRYFREAMSPGTQLALEPLISRLSDAVVLQIAYPVRDAAGTTRFVLVASLDLDKYMEARSRSLVHNEEAMVLMDAAGTLLTWHPGGAKLQRTSAAGSALHRLSQGIVPVSGDGAIEVGGASRVWEVASLSSFPKTGLVVLVGARPSALTSSTDAWLVRTFAIMATVSALAFAGAWALGQWGLRRPIQRVTLAVSRLRVGDFQARIRQPYPRGELGGLMEAFDATADRVESQHLEILRLNKDLEQRVAQRTVALEKAMRAKSDFIANMSHELRTPLNSIIGFSEMLEDEVPGPLNPRQAEFAADILSSGRELLVLVERILAMSKLDLPADRSAVERGDAGVALRECVADHQSQAQASGVALALETEAAVDTAPTDVRALRQILDALLHNAIRFNRAGGNVTVRARRSGACLEVAVSDSGIGIAAADLQRLFEPLTQLDSGPARSHGGIGMGLALAQREAVLRGGSIAVTSEPGSGSTFTVRLPWGDAT